MSVYSRYLQAFAKGIAQSVAGENTLVSITADTLPAKSKLSIMTEHADSSYPTFSMSKILSKPAFLLASEMAAKIKVPGMEITAKGPYINAHFNQLPFSQDVIDTARSEGDAYGSSDEGKGQTVVIDYSSPNIAKPIAFHHIRSTVIGHALANLYRATGWKVEGINYLGDWGKQFGLVAVGLEEYGDPSRKRDVAHLIEVYVKANERAEKDPVFDERARAFFRRMEAKDPEALALWQELRDASVLAFNAIYERLGIKFEHTDGESMYQDKMEAAIAEVERTVGTEISEGALIVKMPHFDRSETAFPQGDPPVLLRKSDGATLYATRELASMLDRYERFQFDRMLYVVATDQQLHFTQLFDVLSCMDKPWADAETLVHVNFGRVKKMSTRGGNIVLLSDVLDEAAAMARIKVDENIAADKIHTDDPGKLAEQIGLGAVVFGDLKNKRESDYEFNWEEILAFNGHTGVYLQYAHARACSILRKGGTPQGIDAGLLTLPEEQALIRLVAMLPVIVSDAVRDNEPFLLSRHLLALGAGFNAWFSLGNKDNAQRVLVEDNQPLKDARLGLTDAVRIALANGLKLLGVPTPEQM